MSPYNKSGEKLTASSNSIKRRKNVPKKGEKVQRKAEGERETPDKKSPIVEEESQIYTKEKREALEEYGKRYKGKKRIHPDDPAKSECLYAEFMELFGASESSQKTAHAFWEDAVEIINEGSGKREIRFLTTG